MLSTARGELGLNPSFCNLGSPPSSGLGVSIWLSSSADQASPSCHQGPTTQGMQVTGHAPLSRGQRPLLAGQGPMQAKIQQGWVPATGNLNRTLPELDSNSWGWSSCGYTWSRGWPARALLGASSWGLSLPRFGAKEGSALTQRSCHLPGPLHTANTKEELCSPLKV